MPVSRPLSGHLPARRSSSPRWSRDIHITRREVDVLRGVVRGESNADIAGALRLREQTVKNHVSVLLQKLQVDNRVQLAVLVAREWSELLDEA